MAIYTRSGEDGSAAGADGRRVRKCDLSICVQGDIDELAATVGLCIAEANASDNRRVATALAGIQGELMVIGGMLANPGSGPGQLGTDRIEQFIDASEDELGQLRTFILPGGCELASRLHVARTVCRRAEREVVAWADAGGTVAPTVLAYLNRLGDALFVMARLANRDAGVEEAPWSRADGPRREADDA